MSYDKIGITRLTRELRSLRHEPLSFVRGLHVSEPAVHAWHFVIQGPEDSVYAGGWYRGRILFPPEYPMKPPSVVFYTPTGRFECGKRICMSNTDFHPETFNPAWGPRSILLGLVSFLVDDDMTTGAIQTSDVEKRRLAAASHEFNARDAQFRKYFPELVSESSSVSMSCSSHSSGSSSSGSRVRRRRAKDSMSDRIDSAEEDSGVSNPVSSSSSSSSLSCTHDPVLTHSKTRSIVTILMAAAALLLVLLLIACILYPELVL